MNHRDKPEVAKETNLRQDRKPYAAPALKIYGMLNRLTQGSGPKNGDGGMGMKV